MFYSTVWGAAVIVLPISRDSEGVKVLNGVRGGCISIKNKYVNQLVAQEETSGPTQSPNDSSCVTQYLINNNK